MTQIAGPTCGYRVVQLHPLLRCNLRCLHCYSTSSPERHRSLSLESLCAALDHLRREGFNAASISGGEPLLYRDLKALLHHIRELGMIATVTTNAMLLGDDQAAMLQREANLVAVSLDGRPESHNRVRGHPLAFERTVKGVACLKSAGVPFGFIFTLTLHNLHELAWVADFAVAHGAELLQVHPLEEVGRAAGQLIGSAPDNLELARAFVEVARLQKQYVGSLTIQYDVADLVRLRKAPERGYAIEPGSEGETRAAQLAELLASVVVEADGKIVPLQYNFSRTYEVGDINRENLPEQFQAWKETSYRRFLYLCRGVYDRLMQPTAAEFPFVNWYSEVLNASHSPTLSTSFSIEELAT